ncbi:hypothetical protein NDU88_002059 [Pleurodeles waltl]|uniref:Reverse transcriptase domain-containing protein n=1 Tax=Pleurodeles waltl TaxID=8319 RepID=A0AAV7LBH8_PLEWA|nr:hypothetical protein NDU88_002059 [Pleurodeles waltl]
MDRAEYAALRLRQSYYVGGNRCGCLLATRLRAQSQSAMGDPLSPLLFLFGVEPLAALIRNYNLISGIPVPGGRSTIYLYADDILLTLTDLSTSLPALRAVLEEFEHPSSYRINWDKSEALPLSPVTVCASVQGIPVKWKQAHLRYLGIDVNRGLDNMVVDKLDPLTCSMKRDFAKFTHLGLSMWGRVQAVRMVTLPRFLYVLGMLPLRIPLSLLGGIDRHIRSFVWGSLRPRLPRTTLLARHMLPLNMTIFMSLNITIQRHSSLSSIWVP